MYVLNEQMKGQREETDKPQIVTGHSPGTAGTRLKIPF